MNEKDVVCSKKYGKEGYSSSIAFDKEINCEVHYVIDFKQKYVIFESSFSTPLRQIILLLDRTCRIIECMDDMGKSLAYMRELDKLNIENDTPFILLKIRYSYESNSNCEYMMNDNSGLLANIIYPNVDKKIKIAYKQKKNVYYNKLESNTLTELYGYYREAKFCCTIKDNNVDIRVNKYGYCHDFLNKILKEFHDYYFAIFNYPIEVAIIDSAEISCDALSLEKLILVKEEICEKNSLFLYRYLLHELVHQIIGIKIKFKGYGGEWLKEGLTEYIQVIFFEKKYNKNMGLRMVEYYRKLYFAYREYDTLSISETYTMMPVEQFNAVIGAKGFFVIRTLLDYFDEDELTVIKKMCEDLLMYKKRISIEDFFIIMQNLCNRDLTQFYNDWIKRSGIPKLILRWKYIDGRVIINFIQEKDNIYSMSVNLRLIYKTQKMDKCFYVSKSKENFEILTLEKPQYILIEPEFRILMDMEAYEAT